MLIEWNAHLFSPDLRRYPFHAQAAYRPDVARLPADPLAAYAERLAAAGIDRAVIVQPEPYGDDHRLVLECLQRRPDLRATSLFYPRDPDAPRKLADLVAREPRIVATRFHAHRGKEEYLTSFDDAGVRTLWEQAVQLGLLVELHIGPNYASQVARVLRDLPQSVVLIDHLAEPHLGTAVEYGEVLALAAAGTVYMKLSGLAHITTEPEPHESVRPLTHWVTQAFGPQRMVWGGSSPRVVDVHLADRSAAEREAVRGGNLSRLLRWDGA